MVLAYFYMHETNKSEKNCFCVHFTMLPLFIIIQFHIITLSLSSLELLYDMHIISIE